MSVQESNAIVFRDSVDSDLQYIGFVLVLYLGSINTELKI